MQSLSPTLHASAVIIGNQAILIRGKSGVGKTSLGHLLVHNAASFGFAYSCWLADDRVLVNTIHNALIAIAPPHIFEKVELYGLGIMNVTALPKSKIALIIDINPQEKQNRLAEPNEYFTLIEGVKVPFLHIDRCGNQQLQLIFVAYTAILRAKWPIC